MNKFMDKYAIAANSMNLKEVTDVFKYLKNEMVLESSQRFAESDLVKVEELIRTVRKDNIYDITHNDIYGILNKNIEDILNILYKHHNILNSIPDVEELSEIRSKRYDIIIVASDLIESYNDHTKEFI